MNKRELILGLLLNGIFICVIVGTRYYYAKQEMDFLKDNSKRQDELIIENTNDIDTNRTNINEIAQLDVDQYNKISELTQEIQNLQRELLEVNSKLDSIDIYQYSNTNGGSTGIVPFEKEFGTQSNYLRIFGRSGIRIVGDSIVDYETDLAFNGSLELPMPEIVEGEIKGEYYPLIPESDFNGIRLRGRTGNPMKIKAPRNQLSIGPFGGIVYNQQTGLTEPVIGFGISYNLFKIVDWK